MISVENLGKRFGARWVFRGLSFQVRCGECLVVLGRNGSGKSTLLRLIARLLPPSEGRVAFDFADYRTGLGYAALDMAMYSNLSVREHLELSADLRGCPGNADRLLEKVGLAYAIDVPAGQLSTGMRARLKLAMAIQSEPRVLMLDEPGASLDEAGRALVDRICEEQTRRGCLIVATNEPAERRYATHELELDS